MRYSQFFVEKCTVFLPFPYNFTFETVFLALHRPNFSRLGYFLTELIIHVKAFLYLPVSHNTSVINRQTNDRRQLVPKGQAFN